MDIYNIAHSFVTNKIFDLMKADTVPNAETTTTRGLLYILIVSPNNYEKIPIQFIPEELSYKRSVDFAEIKPIARNIPKYHYTGGKTTMVLNLDFFAQENDRSDVINIVRRLEALGYSDGYGIAKPKIILVWDQMFRGETWEVTSVDIKLTDFRQDSGFLPQQAYVGLGLALTSEDNPTWEVITEEVSALYTDENDILGEPNTDFTNVV